MNTKKAKIKGFFIKRIRPTFSRKWALKMRGNLSCLLLKDTQKGFFYVFLFVCLFAYRINTLINEIHTLINEIHTLINEIHS